MGTELSMSHPYANRTLPLPGIAAASTVGHATASAGRRSYEQKRIQAALCKVEGKGIVLVLHHAIPREDAWREVSLGGKGIPKTLAYVHVQKYVNRHVCIYVL